MAVRDRELVEKIGRITAEEVRADYQQTAAGREPVSAGELAYEVLPPQDAVPAVTLENNLSKLLLNARGKVVGVVDKATGKNHGATAAANFVTIRKGSATERPTACTRDGDKLIFTFRRSGATAQVNVTAKPRYFVCELTAVSDPEIPVATVLRDVLQLRPDRWIADHLNT